MNLTPRICLIVGGYFKLKTPFVRVVDDAFEVVKMVSNSIFGL